MRERERERGRKREGEGGREHTLTTVVAGGRTAWSCEVVVGHQTIRARYWYDGQYVANAREDAAEVALQLYGVLPAPPGPQPTHYHQQQRQFWGVPARSGAE
ncbi:hypothetical protein Tdes44962_MAKER07715 [Teratosphaeria destructans]|uniref:Uncharacterized protein n=1 Tax=Teratosphaeria destructans TaxID=418781 RepID=A0A9W7SYF9_9PEZI|nr:hypothetical protein Tdes44962_MAKER07715 [Teratosphaeria destructans]